MRKRLPPREILPLFAVTCDLARATPNLGLRVGLFMPKAPKLHPWRSTGVSLQD